MALLRPGWRTLIPLLAAALAVISSGCSSFVTTRQPNLGRIYNRAAQYRDGRRNPVIVIPGILGSRLERSDTGRIVWGAFDGESVDPETEGGARSSALPMHPGKPLSELQDEVIATGVLDRFKVKLAGIPYEQQAYAYILGALGVGGYNDDAVKLANIDYGPDHYTCFQFSYDWRKDNVQNAALLHQFILEKTEFVRAERARRYGVTDEPVLFDIVAHSMGGLLARYYLRYGDQPMPVDGSLPPLTWRGAQHIDRLILVGSPNAGSLQAVQQLVDGKDVGTFLPFYEPSLLGTMPSIYQLLPRPRHGMVVDAEGKAVDLYDLATWERFRWGLLDPDQDQMLSWLLPDEPDPAMRREIAREHLTKCLRAAKGFHEALDMPADPPPGTTLHIIAGDAEMTDARIQVNEETGALKVVEQVPGDGTVTRRSALMDERVEDDPHWSPRLVSPIKWSSYHFVFADHVGMVASRSFTDHMLFMLLEAPRERLRVTRLPRVPTSDPPPGLPSLPQPPPARPDTASATQSQPVGMGTAG